MPVHSPSMPAAVLALAALVARPTPCAARPLANGKTNEAPTQQRVTAPSPMRPHQHYQRGLERLQANDLRGAANSFKTAYELEPNREVLYALGLVFIRLNQPLEAIDALERYLADTSVPMAKDRELVAKEQLAQQQRRVAFLRAEIHPKKATLLLDGKELALADRSTALNPGEHQLKVSLAGYTTKKEHFVVAPGDTKTLQLVLTPTAFATLTLDCRLPDISVLVDGRLTATTPLSEPLRLAVGQRQLELKRPGYATSVRSLDLLPGSGHELPCNLAIVPSAQNAQLSIEVSESDATLLLDGAPLPTDGLVPPGRHMLEVAREGFRPVRQELLIQPGERRRQSARLIPTAAYLKDYSRRAFSHRAWSYIAAGAGTALGAGATVLYFWNDARFDEMQTERMQLLNAGNSGTPWPVDYATRVGENNAALDSVQKMDAVVISLGAAAGAALLTGVVLYLLGEDPYRYDAVVAPAR